MSARSHLPLCLSSAVLRRRGKVIAGPVDLCIKGAGFSVIIGPNGAGKSSILQMLHGLAPLSSGKLTWQGSSNSPRPQQGYVFQTPVMLRRSVLKNLTYPLITHGTPRAKAEARAHEYLARVGLAGFENQPARALSGGERQKLALARALIRKPEFLLLDEPCASLDGPATMAIETILQTTHKAGTRILMATHDIGQARRLADDVLFVLNGQIHEAGPADAFFDSPQTDAARAFLQGDIVA